MSVEFTLPAADSYARPSMVRALAAIAIRLRVRRADARDRAEAAAVERREPPRARNLDLITLIKPFGD